MNIGGTMNFHASDLQAMQDKPNPRASSIGKRKPYAVSYKQIKKPVIGIGNLYDRNKDFREYVDRYCRKHQISVEEAVLHEIVKGVGKMYMEQIGE